MEEFPNTLNRAKSVLMFFRIRKFILLTTIIFLSYYELLNDKRVVFPIGFCCLIMTYSIIRYHTIGLFFFDKLRLRDLLFIKKRTIDILKEGLFGFLIWLIVYSPNWGFTDKPLFYEIKNFMNLDFHTAKVLHQAYGPMLISLLLVVDYILVTNKMDNLVKNSLFQANPIKVANRSIYVERSFGERWKNNEGNLVNSDILIDYLMENCESYWPDNDFIVPPPPKDDTE